MALSFTYNCLKVLLFLCCLLPFTVLGQDTDSLLNAARDKFEHAALDSSRKDLNSALDIDPGNVKALLLRGRINYEQHNYEAAIEDLTRCIDHEPGIIEPYLLRARSYQVLEYHRNYYLQDIDKAIEMDPMNSDLYLEKAKMIVQSSNEMDKEEDHQWAIRMLDKGISYDYKRSELYRYRGDLKFEINQRLSALADIDRAIELDPRDPENFDSRGTMRLFMEDYTGAFRDFTLAIDLSPQNEDHYRKRAHAYFNSGRYQDAIDDLSNTIELVISKLEDETIPRGQALASLSNTYLIRGSALAQINRYGDACSDFKRARDLGQRKAVNYISRYCR